MSTTEWGVRCATDDGPQDLPVSSEEAARKTAEEMKRSYPWPGEIQVIRRKVCDWVVD